MSKTPKVATRVQIKIAAIEVITVTTANAFPLFFFFIIFKFYALFASFLIYASQTGMFPSPKTSLIFPINSSLFDLT